MKKDYWHFTAIAGRVFSINILDFQCIIVFTFLVLLTALIHRAE